MSYDFLGTFSKQQIESLRTFLQGEINKVSGQINHMVLESNKLQKTMTSLIDEARRSNVKLKMFDNVLYKNTIRNHDDIESAVLVQLIKAPYYANIKIKDQYEYKIKKFMDLLEQIQERIHLLRISQSEFQTNIEKINSLFDSKHRFLTVEKEVI